MKVMVGAALAAAVLCGVATAQTVTTPPTTAPASTAPSRCEAFPEVPTTPDGAAANRAAMTAAEAAFNAFDATTRAVLVCRRTEFEELQATSNLRREEHNAGANAMNAAITAWRAEIEEFNAR